jgi:hypothetical protein
LNAVELDSPEMIASWNFSRQAGTFSEMVMWPGLCHCQRQGDEGFER